MRVSASNFSSSATFARIEPWIGQLYLPGDLMQFELFQFKQLLVQKVMDPHRFYVWLDLVRGETSPDYEKKTAVYELELKKAATLFTSGQKEKLNSIMVPAILAGTGGEPALFSKGSGRLELTPSFASAIGPGHGESHLDASFRGLIF